MDRAFIFLGTFGLIWAAIGSTCAFAFKKCGRVGQMTCMITCWLIFSLLLSSLTPWRKIDFEMLIVVIVANGIAVALATVPLWFLRKDAPNAILFGVTTPVAFAVGWCYIAIPWLTACFLFGRCDP